MTDNNTFHTFDIKADLTGRGHVIMDGVELKGVQTVSFTSHAGYPTVIKLEMIVEGVSATIDDARPVGVSDG